MKLLTNLLKDSRNFIGHQDEIRVIIFSNDKKLLFSGSWDHIICIWKIPKKTENINGKKCVTKPNIILRSHTAGITSLCLSNDQKYLISGSKDGTIKIWNYRESICLFTLKGTNSKIYSVAIDKKSKFIISGGIDSFISIWKIQHNRNSPEKWEKIDLYKKLSQTNNPVHLIKFSHDYKYFASSGDENIIYLWKTEDFSLLRKLKGHRKKVFSLAFHRNLPILISGGVEKEILVWNYDKGNILDKIKAKASTTYLEFSPNGENFLQVDIKKNIFVYNTNSLKLTGKHHINEGEMLTAKISQDWKLLALSPFNLPPPKITIWDFFYRIKKYKTVKI